MSGEQTYRRALIERERTYRQRVIEQIIAGFRPPENADNNPLQSWEAPDVLKELRLLIEGEEAGAEPHGLRAEVDELRERVEKLQKEYSMLKIAKGL